MTKSEQSITLTGFRSMLLAAADRMRQAQDELCELDAVAGDGDLGSTLATGFAAVHELLAHPEEDGDVGQILTEMGVQIGRKAPSTIGTLLASAFLQAGRELAGTFEVDAPHIALLLRAAEHGVADRGRAATGQRTVVDAMDAAAAAAEQASVQGLTAVETLERAASGARTGAEATAQMEPRHGRAGWIAERARGHPDAGAVAWAIYVTALADAVGKGHEHGAERSSPR